MDQQTEAQGLGLPATLRGGRDEVLAAPVAVGLGPPAFAVDRAPGFEDLQHPVGQVAGGVAMVGMGQWSIRVVAMVGMGHQPLIPRTDEQ